MAGVITSAQWLKKLANELMEKLKNQDGVNYPDLEAARREVAEENNGLGAAPAGTWTPSMDWYRSVKSLVYHQEKLKNEQPGEDLADLEELVAKLNAVADGVAAVV